MDVFKVVRRIFVGLLAVIAVIVFVSLCKLGIYALVMNDPGQFGMAVAFMAILLVFVALGISKLADHFKDQPEDDKEQDK